MYVCVCVCVCVYMSVIQSRRFVGLTLTHNLVRRSEFSGVCVCVCVCVCVRTRRCMFVGVHAYVNGVCVHVSGVCMCVCVCVYVCVCVATH